jgi:hypothetical protein
VRLVGGEQRAIVVDGERPQVEQLVVQDAQCQTVALLVRPARLMPADVCRVEPGA